MQNRGRGQNFGKDLARSKKWPCLFVASDTTGEKDFEEFFTENENVDMERFVNLGVVKNKLDFDGEKLKLFQESISSMQSQKTWTKEDIVSLFHKMIPNFGHEEKGKYLDSKM